MHTKTTSTPRFFALLFSLFLLSSCALPSSAPMPAPTAALTSTAIPIPSITPEPTFTALPTETPAPVPERAKYTLNTVVDYDAHIVTVDETIVYPNLTGGQLNAITIAVEPNLWNGAFTLNGLLIDGAPITTYTFAGQRLDISLASFLKPNSILRINIQYTLNLPFAEQEDPNIARPRIFGYTKHQLNLVNWYPFVVPYINGEWVLHEPWFYGEHLVYDAADYEVNLRFTDPANAPIVASSGFPEAAGDSTRYTIQSARAFVIAASREFGVSSLQVGDVTISSYYFPLSKPGGQAALQTTAESLQLYSQRYGPYPHKTLSLVMGDFNDGMEYSAFYYLSRDFYNLYSGSPDTYLIFVAAHETAHQWWFDQVGNDQAQQPWLDEALCTYSELLYYETFYPTLTGWWWSYRVDYYKPQGFTDIPIYDGQGFRPYTNAAYFQGAHFLHDLRARIGDEAFSAFLMDYFAQGRGKIVNGKDFFRILSTHTTSDYSDLVRKYFRNVYQ
jgi:hypothetical protein